MKTQAEIQAALNALAFGYIVSRKAGNESAMDTTSRIAEVLAWCIDDRTCPGWKSVNDLIMRLTALSDQASAAIVEQVARQKGTNPDSP